MSQPTLFLIDGSAIAYRSYFAFIHNPLINSKGQNTSAVFGFLRFLFMILDNEKPDYLAVVFDPKGPTFRHEAYSEYKANRQKMPDDLSEQFPILHKVIDALNIPRLQQDGYEADDVIGTLAQRAASSGLLACLVSADKDFMQLVGENVKLYRPSRRVGEDFEIMDQEAVEEKIGLPPDKIVDYLGLTGDTSDNVPGVKGVGPKTAVSLITEYGSLEGALENAENITRTSVRENLKSGHEDALMSKKLVRIETQVPIDFDLESFKCGAPNLDELKPLFKELDFTSLLDRFSVASKPHETKCIVVDTQPELEKLVSKLHKSEFFVLRTEMTGKDPMDSEIAGMAFCLKSGEGYYLPACTHATTEDGGKEICLRAETDLFGSIAINHVLKPLLENSGIKKIGHDTKTQMLLFAQHGINLDGCAFDTMVASYLINAGAKQHSLAAAALEHLNHIKRSRKDLLGSGKAQLSILEVEQGGLAEYLCEEADLVFQLHELFRRQLSQAGLDRLFNEVEAPLVYVLADMERIGVSLDLDFLSKMSDRMGAQVDRLVKQIHDSAGEEFNINSTQQLGEILFEKLKLPKKKRTKTGYSTDAKVLEELAKVHELPGLMLEYRELTKLKSTYVDALPNLVNSQTRRLHTSYNQAVAATGRLSSSDPNLQNIPIRTEIGREIRRAFVPAGEGYVILDADYSQVELRIMAHLSKDPVLLEAFKNEEDIHSKTASLVFQVHEDDLTAEHRRRAKEINFGIMYGMGVYGLATRLQISNEEARDFITSYFALYYKVKEFIDRMHAEVEDKGYVTTMLNRRRYLPEIRSRNRNIQEFAKRTAVNTPIQGSAAELIKVAMLNIWHKLRDGNYKTRMIMQVHDELVFETPESEVDEMIELVRHEMENAIPMDVPIKAEIGVGPNWLEAH